MKKLILTLATIFALGAPASAVIISSNTPAKIALPSMLLGAGESLTYESSGTYTGTLVLEKSFDGSNYATVLSTVNQTNNSFSGDIVNGDRPQFYRFRVSTITAGTANTLLYDKDDFVTEIKNRKRVPTAKFYDETVRLQSKLTYTPTNSGTALALTTPVRLDESDFPNTFNVVTSTGGALLLSGVPTIDTTRPADGTILIIQSSTNTVTFQDADTLTGSGLELGSTTRALGVGDILQLIFRDGAWYEIGFFNN